MRTTVNIDEDILQAARRLAEAQDKTLGEVLSELARKGLRPTMPRRSHRGFPVFDVSEEAPPITPEMVREALDDSG